jgi:cell division protein FtsL
MNRITNLAQKYRQAPWRTQRQWLGLVLLGVVIIATVAGVYLNVTARATMDGREILNLNYDIAIQKNTNADLQTELAGLSSAAVMKEHAEALGYEPAGPENIVYVVVPGYTPDTGINLATTREQPPASIIRPEYKQTLFEWFTDRIQSPAMAGGVLP